MKRGFISAGDRSRMMLAFGLLFLAMICLVGTIVFYFLGKAASAGSHVDLEELDSPYAIMMERNSGKVMASRNGGDRMYPASMTKMMTALVALDYLPDLEQTITFSGDYFDALYEEDASIAGFLPGEEARAIDVLYGVILPSGAECCKEIARFTLGSEEAFVEEMNRKAKELKLSDTHFTNVTGLHDADHYTTCHDLAKLVRYGLDQETFYQIFTTHHYDVPPTNMHPEGFSFWSTLFQATVDEIVNGGEILGGKTGHTSEAGRCLASFARIDGEDYILITGGVPENPRSDLYHIDDAFRAYNMIKE